MNIIEEYLKNNINTEILLGGENSELYFEVINIIRNFTIQELEKHIEHPSKPGYRRHDILDKIKQYKKL